MTAYNDDIFNFENLLVYKKALDYCDFVLQVTEKFPKFEIYELGGQFRRAANSVALNIGEGESGTAKEFLNFIRISQRSVRECIVCTSLSARRKYITENEEKESRKKCSEMAKMMSGLSKSIREKNNLNKKKKEFPKNNLN